MTHMYFSARAEGRISYGHLGRTNSCFRAALNRVISDELWTFRSQDHSLLGAKVPGVELSLPGTFAPWNFHSLELSLPGLFAPWNFRSMELSLPGKKIAIVFYSVKRYSIIRCV